ncbi:MAG TPA: glycosyltransferase family 4 protein [Patescibacteria group bacterium]|nr:glycosyltransferase family 4 protein [Patescibacteria group bacterium]
MNILIFNWRDLKHSWAGGGEIYVFELAKRWVQMGHSVTVFCGQDLDRKLPGSEKYNGITVRRMGNRFSIYIWAVIFYLFQNKEKFDYVIDVENGIPFFTPLFVRKPKTTIVYHVHGKQFFFELLFPLSYIGFFIERYLFAFLYRVIPIIAISKTTKNELIKIGFKKNKIFVVHSGINGKNRQKIVTKKFAHPTILYLGRIKSYKRVDLLVRIFSQILKKVPKAKLIIAGWGTEASSLTDLIMKSTYRKRIKLAGPVSERDKTVLLSKSWVFVNPSIGEGWSISVIESNLHRTPAVAFRVPGLSESIRNKKTGFLVKSEAELIEKICLILKNKTIRKTLSKSSYNWAQQFSWDIAAKKSLHVVTSKKKE